MVVITYIGSYSASLDSMQQILHAYKLPCRPCIPSIYCKKISMQSHWLNYMENRRLGLPQTEIYRPRGTQPFDQARTALTRSAVFRCRIGLYVVMANKTYRRYGTWKLLNVYLQCSCNIIQLVCGPFALKFLIHEIQRNIRHSDDKP